MVKISCGGKAQGIRGLRVDGGVGGWDWAGATEVCRMAGSSCSTVTCVALLKWLRLSKKLWLCAAVLGLPRHRGFALRCSAR